jgi:hypothetical protein
MYVMRISFKPNDYNSLDAVYIDDKPFRPCWKVEAHSTLYTSSNSKLKIDLKLNADQMQHIEQLLDALRKKHPTLSTVSNCCENILMRVSVPTQYGHVTAPFKTVDGDRLLAEHITPGVQMKVVLSPTHVWKTSTNCGLIWTIFDVVANIRYAV